jgi:hypothetical protein
MRRRLRKLTRCRIGVKFDPGLALGQKLRPKIKAEVSCVQGVITVTAAG